MILVIDNYDSFVHNLARHIELAGAQTYVVRNNAVTPGQIRTLNPDAIVISPGPCGPGEAGISTELVRCFGADIPILGICLGHQCIAEAYGGRTIRSRQPIHGKSSTIIHNHSGIFEGIPSPMTAGRYHSLIPDLPDGCPLRITASTTDGMPMAFAHKLHPVYGLQFHPESILTEHGLALVQNFVKLANEFSTPHFGFDKIAGESA